jgi:hypothetical protein
LVGRHLHGRAGIADDVTLDPSEDVVLPSVLGEIVRYRLRAFGLDTTWHCCATLTGDERNGASSVERSSDWRRDVAPV